MAPQVLRLQEKLDAAGPLIWKPTFAIEASPELVMVRAAGELIFPSETESNVICVELTLIAGAAMAVPDKVTVWERFASVTVSMPSTGPMEVGANTTLMLQVACAPSKPSQVSELRKPALAAALIDSSGRSPVFES